MTKNYYTAVNGKNKKKTAEDYKEELLNYYKSDKFKSDLAAHKQEGQERADYVQQREQEYVQKQQEKRAKEEEEKRQQNSSAIEAALSRVTGKSTVDSAVGLTLGLTKPVGNGSTININEAKTEDQKKQIQKNNILNIGAVSNSLKAVDNATKKEGNKKQKYTQMKSERPYYDSITDDEEADASRIADSWSTDWDSNIDSLYKDYVTTGNKNALEELKANNYQEFAVDGFANNVRTFANKYGMDISDAYDLITKYDDYTGYKDYYSNQELKGEVESAESDSTLMDYLDNYTDDNMVSRKWHNARVGASSVDGYGDYSGAIGGGFNAISNDASAFFSNLWDSRVDYMTNEQMAIYNYLYSNKGKDMADKYLDSLNLGEKESGYAEKYAKYEAETNPFLSSLFTVADTLAEPIALGQNVATYMSGNEINENVGFNKVTQNKNNVRSEVQTMIEDNIQDGMKDSILPDWSKNLISGGAKFLYNTGMSTADNLGQKAASGGNSAAMLALMGTSAAQNTMIQKTQEGLSSDKAFAYGLVAGAVEIITEKVPIENLYKMIKSKDVQTLKQTLKSFAKQGLVEGSEEVASDWLDEIADFMINADDSAFAQAYQQNIANGMSESEAMKNAFLGRITDTLASNVESFFSGALSGITMAEGSGLVTGGQSIIRSAINTNNINKAAGTVQKVGTSDSLLEAARNAEEGSEVRKIADQVKDGKLDDKTAKAIINAAVEENNSDVIKIANNSMKYSQVQDEVEKTNKKYEKVQAQRENVSDAGISASEVEGIKQNKDGSFSLKIKGSSTSVKASEATLKSNNDVNVVNMAIRFADNADRVNAYLKGYNGNMSASEYNQAFNAIVKGAKGGLTMTEVMHSGNQELLRQLSTNSFAEIYKYGEHLENQIISQANSADQVEFVKKLTEITGKSVVYGGAEFAKGQKHATSNGYYDPNTDTIHISDRATNPLTVVFAHEFLHSVKNTDKELYNKLYETSLGFFERTNKDEFNRLRASKYAEYADEIQGWRKQGKSQKEIDALVNEEIVANMTEALVEKMAGMKKAELKNYIESMTTDDRSFIQKVVDSIKEFVKNIAAKMTGYKSKSMEAQIWNASKANQKQLQNFLDTYMDVMKEIGQKNAEAGKKGEITELKDADEVDQEERSEYSKDIVKKSLKIAESVNEMGTGNNVEQTEKLLAVHNLTEEQLLWSIQNGGFPAPSIAIIKSGMEHSNYGPISVLFYKETIDPKTSKNFVYGADAYTPTVQGVEYEIKQKEFDRFSDELRELGEKADRYFAYGDMYEILGALGSSVATNLSADEILEKYKNKDSLKAAYLEKIGKHIDAVMVEKPKGYDEGKTQIYKKILDHYGKEAVREFGWYRGRIDEQKKWYEKYGDKFISEIAKEDINYVEGETKAFKLNYSKLKFMLDTIDFIDEYGKPAEKVVDMTETSQAVNREMEGRMDDYTEWLKGRIDSFIGDRGIWNGKSYITESGKRRTFKQLYNAYTIENIVKAMYTGQESRSQNANGRTAEGLQSAAAKSYKSIEEIRKDSGRLNNVNDEEYDLITKELENKIAEVADELSKQVKDGGYYYNSVIEDTLIEAAKGRRTIDAIKKIFSEEGIKIKNEMAGRIMDLYEETANIPTKYFEAKPERAIPNAEIAKVVIPDNVGNDLVYELEKNNVKFEIYEAGNEEERKQLVNDKNIMFSKKANYKTDSYYEKITPATIDEARNISMLDERNIARFRKNVDDVFSGKFDKTRAVAIGMPSKVLTDRGIKNHLIRITQNVMYKIAYPENYFGGKHNLGISAVKNLPLQISDPIAITKNNKNNEGRVVLWTNWITEDGKSIMIGFDIGTENGGENTITTLFQANEKYQEQFFAPGMIIYTKNNESIDNLLDKRRHVPVVKIDDTFYKKTISKKEKDVKGIEENEMKSKKDTSVSTEFNAIYNEAERKSVRSIASAILRDFGSTADRNVTDKAVAGAYTMMKNGSEQDVKDYIRKKIVDPVADKATQTKTGDKEVRKALRDYFRTKQIRLSDTQKAEIRHSFGSLAQFTKYMAQEAGVGTVRFSDAGTTTLDENWSEINALYGNRFSDISDADQPNAVLLMFHGTKDVISQRTVSEEERTEATNYLYDQIKELDNKQNGLSNILREGMNAKAAEQVSNERIRAIAHDLIKEYGSAYNEQEFADNLIAMFNRIRERGNEANYKDFLEIGYQLVNPMIRQSDKYDRHGYAAEQMFSAALEIYQKYFEAAGEMKAATKVGNISGRISERYENRIARLKENARKTELKEAIYTKKGRLDRMLDRPTKTSHIATGLIHAAVDIASAINTENTRMNWRTKDKLENLRAKYEELRSKDYYKENFDDNLSDMIEQLKRTFQNKRLNQLNEQELSFVDRVLNAILVQVSNENKLISTKRKESVSELRAKGVSEIMDTKGISRNNVFMKLLNSYQSVALNFERLMRRSFGYKDDSVGELIAGIMKKGEDRYLSLMQQEEDIFQDVLGLENRKNLFNLQGKKKTGRGLDASALVTLPGTDYKITKGMRLALIMHLMNKDSLRHIAYGGFKLPDMNEIRDGNIADAYAPGYGTNYVPEFFTEADVEEAKKRLDELESIEQYVDKRTGNTFDRAIPNKSNPLYMEYMKAQAETDKLSPTSEKYYAALNRATKAWERYQDAVREAHNYLDAIVEAKAKEYLKELQSDLTDYEKSFLKDAQEFFWDFSGKQINEVTQNLYGYDKATVKNYFPISVDKGSLETDSEGIKRDGTLEGMKILKDRVQSKKPILLDDISRVVQRHIESTARFAGWAEAVRDAKSLLRNSDNGVSIEGALNSKWTPTVMKYIQQSINDIESPRKSDSFSRVVNKIRSNFAGSTLTGNFTVMIKQAASFPTAMAETGIGPTVKALKNLASKGITEVESRTPLLRYRENASEFTYEAGTDLTQNKVVRGLANMISWMDVRTVRSLEYAAKYAIDNEIESGKLDLEKESDEYWDAVTNKFNNVIRRTQPNYTTLERPELLKNTNAALRTLFMFKTQPVQNYGILYDAAGEFAAKCREAKKNKTEEALQAKKEAGANLARAITSNLVSQLVFAMMTVIGKLIYHNPGDLFKDDDKDGKKEFKIDELGKMILDSVLSSEAGMVLGGQELYEFIASRFTGDTYYGLEDSLVEMVNDVTDSIDGVQTEISNLADAKTDEDKEKYQITLAYKVRLLATNIAAMAKGVPVNNIYKPINSIVGYAQDAVEAVKSGDLEPYSGKGFLFSDTSDVESQKDRIIDAYYEGDDEEYERLKQQAIDKKIANYEKKKAAGNEDLKEFDSEEDRDEYYTDSEESDIKSAIAEKYIAGSISREDAVKFLMDEEEGEEGEAYTEADAYWDIDKWDYRREHGSAEGYDKYAEIKTAITDGSLTKETFSRYLDNGVEAKTIKAAISSWYHEWMKENGTDSTMNANVLSAYQKLGYDRTECNKQIQKWIKENL